MADDLWIVVRLVKLWYSVIVFCQGICLPWVPISLAALKMKEYIKNRYYS